MSDLKRSWVETANTPETDFPLNNLPYGSFLSEEGEAHCGVAIGDMILDCQRAEEAGAVAECERGMGDRAQMQRRVAAQ